MGVDKMSQKKSGLSKYGISLILMIIVFCLMFSGCSSGNTNNLSSVETSIQAAENSVSQETPELPSPEPSAEVPSGSSFEVHFIDVGQADSALILCDGNAMLIDGGNVADSDLIYTYLKNQGITHLDYMVCTHAHEDHVGGLAGALNYATVDVAYCPVTSYDSTAFNNFVKYLGNQGVDITVPSTGDTFTLGSAEVTVLGPINSSDEPNNTSIVLRIVYGNTSFLFAGDAEREEEQDILNAGYTLASTVLKVGHHGSENSTTYPFLREIMPEYAVISVGADNSYGHPTEETLSRLRDADVKVYRTDMQGDIICTSDGKSVSFTVERNADVDTLSSVGLNSTQTANSAATDDPVAGTDYVINTNTGKFHYPWCSSVDQMNEENKQYYTGSRDELIAEGYSPCGRCNP
jgi:competence protein ComEC